MTAVRSSCDLGLIVATGEEFDYMRESVRFEPVRDEGQGFWYEFEVPGGRLGVAHVLFDVGLTAATAAASRLLARFGPQVLAVAGIGGALSADLALGDVVVASVIEEYLKDAKVTPDGNSRVAFIPAGSSWPVPERLRGFASSFRYVAEDRYAEWLQSAQVRADAAGLPFATTPGARREPAYFVLPVASGDLLVTDPAFKEWLVSHGRKRAVVEMEAAGVARAVREHDGDVSLLVLRGISDFADERKAALDAVADRQAAGAWRRYAAQNAIELLLTFLTAPSFPWTGTGHGSSAPAKPAARPAGKYVIDATGAQGVQIGDGNQQHLVFHPGADADPGRA